MHKKRRPYVLSLAGFDPSGGAGLLADTKTMEANRTYGLGVCTALTWQNDIAFKEVAWVPAEKIQQQAALLFERFTIDFVKIGLIESGAVLLQLIQFLHAYNKAVKIVFDPILKASAGFTFHEEGGLAAWRDVLSHIMLITPNHDEMVQLMPGHTPVEGAAILSAYCPVLLKGGHDKEAPGKDYLFMRNKRYAFNPKDTDLMAKHGSGCVLSSAVTANLARGYTLLRACQRAKQYTARFLKSNTGMLGYHKL